MKDFCLIDEVVWIPIEEELPEYENIPVLFWIENGTPDNKPGCYIGVYSKRIYDNQRGAWFDIYGSPIWSGVTHWASLPKGPSCKMIIGLEIRNDIP